MILLTVKSGNEPSKTVEWHEPVLKLGRNAQNALVIRADNVSGEHGEIFLRAGCYVYRDLHSTNGSLIIRDNKKILLKHPHRMEQELEPGDVICLASIDNAVHVETILAEPDDEQSQQQLEKTILAAENAQHEELEDTLGHDFSALRESVRLAREISDRESIHEIADLVCQTCLRVFAKARRARFLVAREDQFVVEWEEATDDNVSENIQSYSRNHTLLQRCLQERKGFLFLFEQDQMQAVATRVSAMEPTGEEGELKKDQVMMCCPLLRQNRCYGFIQVTAPLAEGERESLSRRDLSLATLMSHLVAARVHDLETHRQRLKVARKATAGYLAATVGHCFKNLLFVPNSMSRMLPVCLKQGKMDEVHWMLARNRVSIHYLDILSNEFAAASKDPAEGFETCPLADLLQETIELVEQIAPDRVTGTLNIETELPATYCHPAALKRLLMNLLLNSIDALFGEELTGQGHVTLRAVYEREPDRILMEVSDNGPGIPEAIVANLRIIYDQVMASADALAEIQNIAERVHSTKQQGYKEHYGLGFLFVCQTVHLHRGSLRIDTQPGRGTTFRIRIPRRQPQ